MSRKKAFIHTERFMLKNILQDEKHKEASS